MEGGGKKRKCGTTDPFLHTVQHGTLLIQVSDTISELLLLHWCSTAIVYFAVDLYLLYTLPLGKAMS